MEIENQVEENLSQSHVLGEEENAISSHQSLLFFFIAITLLLICVLLFLLLRKKLVSSFFAPPISPLAVKINHKKKTEKPLFETIGFLPSWSAAKQVNVRLKDLNELIYFGFSIDSEGNIVKFQKDQTSVLEWSNFTSAYFTDIRNQAKNNGVKILVAINSFDNKTIDDLLSNPNSETRAIAQIKNLLETYQMDGVNIDFEYVTDTNRSTVQYLNHFLEKLTRTLKKDHPERIVSVDVNATALFKDQAYDMVKIGEVVDQVIVMAYEYTQSTASRAGFVAPIDSLPNQHSVNESITSLLGRVPFEKVILGVPFYGYEWQTATEKEYSPTVPNTGALASYKRVKELLNNRTDLTKHFDNLALSPWLSYQQSGVIKQIYYEDEKSLLAKVNFSMQKRLGGIAIWALGYEGDYPNLWQAIEKSQK